MGRWTFTRLHIIAACIVILAFTKDTTSYRTGAPTRACADMTPGHGFPVKNDPAPFLVEVSKTQYGPNERIYVRIRACGPARFKGFLIQPRSAVYPERPAFLGAFLRVQGTRYECVRSGAVLTHSSSDDKQSVTMTWIAPPAAAGHVVFRVTVVQDYSNYWVGINSPVVYDGVSRDLTMMQAFILQSPTDSSCLPGRQRATSTTEPVPEITTEGVVMETTQAIEPTTTRPIPQTTTTMTTTTRRPTTRPTTTVRTTQAPTQTPTTPVPVPTDIFYDYVWETSTNSPKPTTQRPTTAATTRATNTTKAPNPTTTEYVPPPIITTTQVFEPTTTLARTTATTRLETTAEVITEAVTETPTTVQPSTTTTTPPPPPPTTTTVPPPPPPTTTTSTTTRQPTTTTLPDTTTEGSFSFTTTVKQATTTTLPTPTTTQGWQQPTTTTSPPPPPTTTSRTILKQTTTEAPIPTTQLFFEPRTTASLAPTTTRILIDQFNAVPEPTTPIYRPSETRIQPGTERFPDLNAVPEPTTPIYRPSENRLEPGTELFPDYYDPNPAVDVVPPSYYDYLDINNQNPVVSETNRPVFTDATKEPPYVPGINKERSSTVWTPTRPWNMPSHRYTTTVASTKREMVFRPPASPVTRLRLPYTTTSSSYIPSTVETMQPAQQPTIRMEDLLLTPDPACGVTQGCFDDCSNGVCNFIVSWVPEREKTIFEVRTKPRIAGQYWAAIGFSDDKMMGLDSVTECITEGDKINVYQSYNLDYYRNMRLLTPTLGILDQSGSYRDGIFHCKFTRENYVTGEKDVFDLSKNWHMMFADGPAVNGIKIPHRYDVVPPVSADRIDLQQYPPVHEAYSYRQALKEDVRVVNVTDVTVLPSKERSIAVDAECGSTRSCFQECSPSGCHFIVSWTSHDDYVTFRTRAVVNETSNIWIAIAFSDDKLMGDDSVVQCVTNGNGDIDIRHSFNNGKNNVRIENSELGLINTSASLVDGVFECDFVRLRHVGDYEHIYNLDRKWNLLFAHGKSKRGIMLPHSLDHSPHVSDDAVDFRKSAPSHITASTFFIKIHASIMIFAWILCASLASVIGRYFQPYWWGEKMLGSKVWVKVHWLFVLLTCGSVIAGFTVIFVGVNGISQLYEHPETGFNGTHPIMGLIVTLLALLNPLLLCLKPSEDSSGRAFFNCLYWLVEIGAHVLAVVTIYAGFGLTSDFVPHFFTFMLIGFTVYQILVLLFMEALKSFDAKKTIEKKKVYLYEMQIRPWHARKNNSLAAYMDLNHTSKHLKQTVFATHLILLSALTTTMLVLIITGYH